MQDFLMRTSFFFALRRTGDSLTQRDLVEDRPRKVGELSGVQFEPFEQPANQVDRNDGSNVVKLGKLACLQCTSMVGSVFESQIAPMGQVGLFKAQYCLLWDRGTTGRFTIHGLRQGDRPMRIERGVIETFNDLASYKSFGFIRSERGDSLRFLATQFRPKDEAPEEGMHVKFVRIHKNGRNLALQIEEDQPPAPSVFADSAIAGTQIPQNAEALTEVSVQADEVENDAPAITSDLSLDQNLRKLIDDVNGFNEIKDFLQKLREGIGMTSAETRAAVAELVLVSDEGEGLRDAILGVATSGTLEEVKATFLPLFEILGILFEASPRACKDSRLDLNNIHDFLKMQLSSEDGKAEINGKDYSFEELAESPIDRSLLSCCEQLKALKISK